MYLGLVLVGATPQVLAQVADLSKLTREQKCELSAQMGNEASSRFYKLGYRGEFISFLPTSIESAFDKEDFVPIYDISLDLSFSKATFPEYSIRFDPKWSLEKYSESDASDLIEAIINLSKNYSIRSLPSGGKQYISISAKVISNKADFSVSISFSESSPDRAKAFAAAYNYLIEEGLCLYDNPEDLTKLLVESTTISVDGDQVFIVTRLPRAGLDSLLAKSAK